MKDRFYKIARHRRYDEHQRALASMVYKFSDRKVGLGVRVNKLLDEDKPVTKSN